MQFNHPEVLYGLFFLIIPVIVHLFQLRKFRKEKFTNVKFLKKLTRQTRKSSQLKKWLVLATRLLLLSCIIFAFAQPYLPQPNAELAPVETIIYLDNSYSMQAPGQRGRLLDRSKQELLEELQAEREVTLLTNDEEYSGLTRTDLQNINFSSRTMDLETVWLRAQNRFSKNTDTNKKLLIISDFVGETRFPTDMDRNINVFALPLKAENKNNISLDSLIVTGKGPGIKRIRVLLSHTGENPGSTPISLYSGERLIGKSSAGFTNESNDHVEFPVEDETITAGRVELQDNNLQFDNTLYFTLNTPTTIEVSIINAADDDFLQRIFRGEEFNYSSMSPGEVDYNTIAAARVVILNEVPELPAALSRTLAQKAGENVVFIIIPAGDEPGPNLRSLLSSLGFTGFGNKIEEEKLISGISFEHPLFQEVFEEQISNFEYPKVQSHFRINNSSSTVLKFEDNSPFLTETGGNFLFTAPLNKTNSNFQQSPLIVPTFYNIGISALRPAQLYYLLGHTNQIEVPVELGSDRILEMSSSTSNFIPQQQNYFGKVEIVTEELPGEPGNYQILNEEEVVLGVSFNIPRKESLLNIVQTEMPAEVQVVDNISDFFSTSGFSREKDTLWKWFIIFALLFLIIETLLLKYFK